MYYSLGSIQPSCNLLYTDFVHEYPPLSIGRCPFMQPSDWSRIQTEHLWTAREMLSTLARRPIRQGGRILTARLSTVAPTWVSSDTPAVNHCFDKRGALSLMSLTSTWTHSRDMSSLSHTTPLFCGCSRGSVQQSSLALTMRSTRVVTSRSRGCTRRSLPESLSRRKLSQCSVSPPGGGAEVLGWQVKTKIIKW